MRPVTLILLLAVVLSACAPTPPREAQAAPAPPTATVWLIPTPLAAEGRSTFTNLLVYDVPAMYQVQIKTVTFQTLREPTETLAMDIFYPSDRRPGAHLAAVVIANAFPMGGGRKDWGLASWARLIAAHGLVGVTYDTRSATDLEAVAEHLRAHSAELGVDANRLGVMGASFSATLAETFVYQPNRDYVKFAVFYYPYLLTPDNFMRDDYNALGQQYHFYAAELPDVKQLRADLPVFVVRCGNDNDFTHEPVDRFAQFASKKGAPLTLIRFEDGSHFFDTTEAAGKNPRDQAIDIIKQTLAFMKTHASSE